MARDDGKGGDLVAFPGRQRPDPPAEMLPDQAEVWRQTVNSMRPDWFASWAARTLLRHYCLVAVIGDRLAQRLRCASPMSREYLELTKSHREATKSLLQLATALRLTPASNRKNVRDGRGGPGDFRPWEVS